MAEGADGDAAGDVDDRTAVKSSPLRGLGLYWTPSTGTKRFGGLPCRVEWACNRRRGYDISGPAVGCRFGVFNSKSGGAVSGNDFGFIGHAKLVEHVGGVFMSASRIWNMMSPTSGCIRKQSFSDELWKPLCYE